MHKDYFGNLIEVGDVILRNNNSKFKLHKVLRVTSNSVGITRMPFQNTKRKYLRDYNGNLLKNPSGYGFLYETVDLSNKPLYVQYLQCINLSKLESNQVQNILNNYLNEI